ncbi:MAG: UDP-N-acetylmuramate--L-alanine ligase [Deltaproteobacteria bacterium]
MIGIGGISMSGLAEILIKWGYVISGSDLNPSHITNKLQNSGVNIGIPHQAENVDGAAAVVYTAAVKPDNPEIIRAKELNLPLVDRATLLGEITGIYQKTIAVSGTHGKTTTTSMIAVTLTECGLDPTVLVGGELGSIGGNYRIGSSNFLVTEACEYVESFLKFYPDCGVILNVEMDHLDFFKDIEHVKSSFLKFGNKVSDSGAVIGNFDDENVVEIFKDINRKKISFGITNNADWKAEDISFNARGCAGFSVFHDGLYIGNIQLSIPGRHNVYNALACISACSYYGAEFEKIKASLERFTGVKRRFEYVGEINGVRIVDDYAHHPSEVKATLDAASKQNPNSLWCIFQPHTYTRTKSLLQEFSTAFGTANRVVITDIYAARETNTGMIHSKDLVDAINKETSNAVYAYSFEEAVRLIKEEAKPGDLVITMGAGNIYKVGDMILEK